MPYLLAMTKMPDKLEFPDLDSAVSTINNLSAAIAEAETLIADNQREMALAEESLASLLAEPTTPTNKQYLKAAKTAWRASIKAYKLSIIAFQGEIDSYTEEIDSVLKQTPEARLDN